MTFLHRTMLRATLLVLVLLGLGLAGWTGWRLWALGIPPAANMIRPYLTLVASVLVAVGGIAALGNRTWGLLVLVPATGSFAGVWVFGVAPFAYVGIAVLGQIAFALAAVSLRPRHGVALGAAAIGVTVVAAAAATFAGPGVPLLRAILAP